MEASLSKRGADLAGRTNLLELGFKMYIQDPYDKDYNPQGFINLGVSENKICFDLLHERLTRPDMICLEPSLLQINAPWGIIRLREEAASFLSDYCQAPAPLNPDNIIVMNGCGSILCALSTAIFNQGDGFLIPTPYYSYINEYMFTYSGLKPVHVHLSSKVTEAEKYPFQLTIKKLEEGLEKGRRQGIKIRALVLINPQNPLGEIYSKELLTECLEFGQRYNLHVIVDEIYMLSIFDNITFTSVLSFHEVPDPERTHFVWGLSKDFGMTGMRVGMVYTKNQHVLNCMKRLSFLHQCPGPTQYMISQLLGDREWLDNVFFNVNKQRLKESQLFLVNGLQDLGIPVLKNSAGLYVWADFRKFLTSQTLKAEMELWHKINELKVYIAPGKAFECCEPGWFRLTFSLPRETLQTCLKKLRKLLRQETENTNCI
ncbi:1-aminocyclopropane-1-carboxylate synthase-like protein 1 [Pelodytes ibericus]